MLLFVLWYCTIDLFGKGMGNVRVFKMYVFLGGGLFVVNGVDYCLGLLWVCGLVV